MESSISILIQIVVTSTIVILLFKVYKKQQYEIKQYEKRQKESKQIFSKRGFKTFDKRAVKENAFERL